MRVKFSRDAVRFIDKVEGEDKGRVQQKIKTLSLSIENQGIIPFKESDIKKLSGAGQDTFECELVKSELFSE